MLEPFVLRPSLYNLASRSINGNEREREREASLFPIDKSSAQSDRSSPRVDDLKTGPYRGTIRRNGTARLERIPGTSLSRECLPSFNVPRVVEDSQRLLGKLCNPVKLFHQTSRRVRVHTPIYIHIYIYMAHEPTTKDPGPLQISFRLFDYLTDATIKSSPIIGDSPVYFSRCPAVPLGNHGSFVFLRPPRFISLPYDFSRSLDTLDFP